MLTVDGLRPPPQRGGAKRAAAFLRPWLLGAAGSAYLFSIGWTRWKNRAAIVELCHHFGYHHESREAPELPMVSLGKLLPEDSLIDVRAIDAVDGNVSEHELIVICRLIQARQPRKLFELGTFDGRTTLNMAVNAGAEATVFTLDLPRSGVARATSPIHPHELRYAYKSESGARYRGANAAKRIVQLYGDSGTFAFDAYYGAVDLVFIDASHTFEYVVNDSLQALRMLRPSGGAIIWHDYGRWDGVTAALNALRRAYEPFFDLALIEGTTLAWLDVQPTTPR